jgi:hypothetical protein
MRRLLPSAEWPVLVLLLALFVVKAFIPAWKTLHSDFPNYYIVARLLHEHYAMDKIYDWIWLQRVKDHWSIQQPLVGFVGLTPFSALPIIPLAWLDVLEAKRIWLVVNLAVLATSLFELQRLTSLGTRHVVLIALLAIIPLRNNFVLGQMHLVVLGLLVLAYWFDTRKMCGFSQGLSNALCLVLPSQAPVEACDYIGLLDAGHPRGMFSDLRRARHAHVSVRAVSSHGARRSH